MVVLKFLNQELEDEVCPPVLPQLQDRVVGRSPLDMARLHLLRALYALCRDDPERIRKYLVQYNYTELNAILSDSFTIMY